MLLRLKVACAQREANRVSRLGDLQHHFQQLHHTYHVATMSKKTSKGEYIETVSPLSLPPPSHLLKPTTRPKKPSSPNPPPPGHRQQSITPLADNRHDEHHPRRQDCHFSRSHHPRGSTAYLSIIERRWWGREAGKSCGGCDWTVLYF